MKVEAVEPGCWLIDDSILLRTVDHSPGQGRGLVVGPLLPGQQSAVGRYVVSADPDGRHYDIRSELGQEVRVAGPAPQPLTTLILGGARSGKSREAERRLAGADGVVYAATSARSQDDREWQARIEAHRQRRPERWRTVESPDLVALLSEPGPPLLIDCLTLWLSTMMDKLGAWDDGWIDAEEVVGRRIDELVAAWGSTRRRSIAVSNEVGSGIVPDTSAGRRFRDTLGRLNASMAAASDEVLLCLAGRVLTL
jgi:adenosylcobinamide kinase / adenosylcobinamide-phosphate guanylyltransferase